MSVVTSHGRQGGSWGRSSSGSFSRGSRQRTREEASRIERAQGADLVALAKRHGVAKLVRAGREWKGLCPFHAEKTPSFTIVPEKRFFHCHGCGWHGDAIKFHRAVTGDGFAAALDALTGEAPAIPRPRGNVRSSYPSPSPSPLPQGEGENENGCGSSHQRVAMSDHEAPCARGDTPDPDRQRDIRRAAAIWRDSRPANGTLVEVYLRSRGIDVSRIGGVPPTIRFHPALMQWDVRLEMPCMVALLRGPDGKPTGIHRTYLAADGTRKAQVRAPKMVLGGVAGSAIPFTPWRATMAIGEGIETTLSAMCALGIEWTDSRLTVPGFVCGVSLGNIAGRGTGRGDPHPDPSKVDDRGHRRRLPARQPDMDVPGLSLPPVVRAPVLLVDRDGADPLVGERLVDRAINRWLYEGRQPKRALPPAGMDFNDWWVETQRERADG